MSPHLALPLRVVSCLALLPGSSLTAVAAAQTDSARSRQVLAAEDQRFDAMVRGDTATLRPLLAEDLTYTHASGDQDTKAEFLRSLGSGALRYERIAPEDRHVQLYGAVATVAGRSLMRVGPRGRVREFRIRYLAVYAQQHGQWQLAAWQATRVPS